MNRDDAEEFTQSLGQIGGGLWRQIALAKRLGVPKALGLGTDDWVQQRLGGYVRMSAEDRRSAHLELAAQGETAREIARITGAGRGTVLRDLAAGGPNGPLNPLDAAEDGPNGPVNEIGAKRKASEEARKAILQAPSDPALPEGIYAEDFFTGATADRIADESVQLIFTDPPYDRDSAKLYGKAARVAARILKPGGSFIAYSGQKYLPDVYGWINQPALRYWWTFALAHGSGDNQLLQKLGVRCAWKPLVWYVKGTRGDVAEVLADVLQGAGREKSDHPWQQAEAEAAYFIEKLTSPGGVVVDFFIGSGTTKIAADKLGRRFIGFEIDSETAVRAAARIREAADRPDTSDAIEWHGRHAARAGRAG